MTQHSNDRQVRLRLAGIVKTYRRERKPFTVIDNVSIHVMEREFVTLIGPSGSGKSTLFRLIGGIERPDKGDVYLNGRLVTGTPGLVSYMPQQASLFPWLTVQRNISAALEIAGLSRREASAGAQEWLRRIGLADTAAEYPDALSGGMQQRVSFLRALLMPRDMMCLDEPFAALDALTRTQMQQWLLQMWEQQRRSVLFVTHSIEEALTLSDRIYVLSKAPARVLREIEVPFGRPRQPEVWAEAAFAELKREILSMLKAESGHAV